MTYLRVRNFSELQHYNDRPDNPWIRFYIRTLDDEELNALPVATRLLFDRLLLLAQRFANVIPSDPERVAKLTCIETKAVREGIQQLLEGRWIKETTSPRRASKRASKTLPTMLSQSRGDKNPPYPPKAQPAKPVVYDCPVEGCSRTTRSQTDLDVHLEVDHNVVPLRQEAG